MLPLKIGSPCKSFSYTTILCTPKSSQENKAIKGLNKIKAKLKDIKVQTRRKEFPTTDKQ